MGNVQIRRFNSSSILALGLLLLSACGGGSSPLSSGEEPSVIVPPTTDTSAISPPGNTRDWIRLDDLSESAYPHASPIHSDYFMPVGQEDEAHHPFSGTITLNSRRIIGNFSEFYIDGDESFKNFPDVDLSFFSHQGFLIPLNRDRQVTLSDNSFWGIILDPGKVWSEASDDGWSRASFPFTFISARRNQAHNGVATFLYNDTEMTRLRFQITQETALWFKQDMYGQLDAQYNPKLFPESDSVMAAFDSELAQTETIRPWSELNQIGDAQSRLSFNDGLPETSISQAALIKDEVIYLQGCNTRYGRYPYCRWMRNSAYSITKSVGLGLTMFRLAHLFGPQVYDLYIEDYLSVTSPHNGWRGVTFGNVLDMVAGIGDAGNVSGTGDIFADENGPKMERWIKVNDEKSKLDLSFSYGDYNWGPGQIFRYNSALSFVLAAAIDKYYQSEVGEGADVWQMMEDRVFNQIGIQHVPMLRTIETNDQAGIAEMFHGLYPNLDDMAKLSRLLMNNGRHNNQQLLDAQSVQEALFQTERQGVRSWWEDNAYGLSRYLHGFWSSPFSDGDCLQQIPYMSGYGGNIFAVQQNNIAMFRFSDSERYSPASMIRVANDERSICEM